MICMNWFEVLFLTYFLILLESLFKWKVNFIVPFAIANIPNRNSLELSVPADTLFANPAFQLK
jgi:hypothetical protein